MFSLGMFSFLPARMAVRKRGFELGSPPPIRAAMVISRITRVKTRPRLASVAAFLCLMVAHFECPDIASPLFCFATASINRPPGGRPAINFGEISGAGTMFPAFRALAIHDAETYGK